MKKYTVKTQEQWDAVPQSETEFREIWIENSNGIWISVTQIKNATVRASDSATVRASDSATVRASGSATVRASDSATVRASDSATVHAWDSATVHASDSATVRASGSATVHAWGSATVRAWGSATKLYGHEDSIFVLHNDSSMSSLTNDVIVKTINKPATLESWISKKCAQHTDDDVVIYKRVSADFKTQERTKNETVWTVGREIEVPNWVPDKEECGEGKFHACNKPWHCDEFRSTFGDKYIAIKVRRDDMKFWPNGFYPNKVAFKKGFVMYECDIDGNEIRA